MKFSFASLLEKNESEPLSTPTHKQVAPRDWSLLCLFWFAATIPVATGRVHAEVANRELPAGFSVVAGKHIDVITDMPLSDELRELALVFDAAVPQWCKVFDVPLASVADWRVEAFVMLERQRFITAGLLPPAISHFTYGFQLGDRLWVTEQPSAYYRRHLLLHEGTHWMMVRKYGRQAPPWLMEGMAEWLGTHRWDGQQLQMGIIPTSREQVPYWGRTKVIQEQLADGVAPSLESILRYSDTAHQQQDAYAWSWAAVVFLKNHSETAATFDRLLSQPLQGRDDSNRWFFRQLSSRWPRLRQEWNAALSDLDYGFTSEPGMLTLSAAPQLLTDSATLTISADRSWQASGSVVAAGTRITVSATGEYILARQPRPWICFPDGVTLEYYRGQPLGKLMMTCVAPLTAEPDFSQSPAIIPIGSGGQFTVAQGGELHFRINEATGDLADNSGSLTITISP